MSVRKFNFVPGEYYHIYNRGNSKQTIFLDHHDYSRFLKLMYLCNSDQSFKLHLQKGQVFYIDRGINLVMIGAYCLMPNHFHILISPCTEDCMSKFMQKLTTGYSMYFNNKYERTGGLFEGKFKAQYVDADVYLQYLFAYIHLNPMKLYDGKWREIEVQNKVEAQKFVKTYKYSSLVDYLVGSRKEARILNREVFPLRFTSSAEIENSLFEWVNKEVI